jgi:hypothetical protein
MTKAATSKKPAPPPKDTFLEDLKAAVRGVINDGTATKRDVNQAVANGAKLLQIEHKINPAESEDFFG